ELLAYRRHDLVRECERAVEELPRPCRVHHRIVSGQEKVGLECPEATDRLAIGGEVIYARRDQELSVVPVDAALEHRVDHDRGPAAWIPDPEVPERVAGEVQHLDAPVVTEPD